MQKRIYYILFFLFLGLSHASFAATPSALQEADSLHAAKQYTQAFQRYQAIYQGGHYSTAMLLRMAYIQEGLGHLGDCLYYLNLYFLASHDTQALRKMEELAEKNNLEGYKTDESTRVTAWLQEHYDAVAMLLASLSALLLALLIYQRVKKHLSISFTAAALVLTLAVMVMHINLTLSAEHGIVAQPVTYLMSGPSAGASVIAVIGEGHQLEIQGREDVWLRVSWKEKEAYVKEFLIRPVHL